MKSTNESFEGLFSAALVSFFPFLRYTMPERIMNYITGRNKFLENGTDFTKLVQVSFRLIKFFQLKITYCISIRQDKYIYKTKIII